jgi:membrane dipeptidase
LGSFSEADLSEGYIIATHRPGPETRNLLNLSKSQEERAREIHRKAVVIDGLTLRFYLEDPRYYDKWMKSGVTAGNMTVAGYALKKYVAEFSSSLKSVEYALRLICENPDKALLVSSVDDISRAKAERRFGVILGFQDAKPICDQEWETYYLNVFYRLGVRIIQLTENDQNLLGTGCCERVDGGLTWLGIDMLEKLNKLGIVVDLSHCGDATTMEAIERSKDPVVFTHSNVRSLCSSARNKKDEHIQALAEKGGASEYRHTRSY